MDCKQKRIANESINGNILLLSLAEIEPKHKTQSSLSSDRHIIVVPWSR
jgi:hypothetical protein